jgi:hypothetical protein
VPDSAPPADRTPAGHDPDGTPYYPTTVGQLGLCGPRSDDPGVGPDAARHTPDADDQPPRDFPEEGSFAVTRTFGSLRVWGDRRWRWDGHDWQPVVSVPPADDRAARDANVILFKPSGKYYTEEPWQIPHDAIGPYDMQRSPDFRRIDGGPVLVDTQEPWGYPHLFPALVPSVQASRDRWRDFGHRAAAQVAAVRALADEAEKRRFPLYGGTELAPGLVPTDQLRTALDGPVEAPAMSYELSCVTCATSPYFRLEPFDSDAERQAWADAHQAATGHEDFRFANTPVPVGLAEAAEPATFQERAERFGREFAAGMAEGIGASEPAEPRREDADELLLVAALVHACGGEVLLRPRDLAAAGIAALDREDLADGTVRFTTTIALAEAAEPATSSGIRFDQHVETTVSTSGESFAGWAAAEAGAPDPDNEFETSETAFYEKMAEAEPAVIASDPQPVNTDLLDKLRAAPPYVRAAGAGAPEPTPSDWHGIGTWEVGNGNGLYGTVEYAWGCTCGARGHHHLTREARDAAASKHSTAAAGGVSTTPETPTTAAPAGDRWGLAQPGTSTGSVPATSAAPPSFDWQLIGHRAQALANACLHCDDEALVLGGLLAMVADAAGCVLRPADADAVSVATDDLVDALYDVLPVVVTFPRDALEKAVRAALGGAS